MLRRLLLSCLLISVAGPLAANAAAEPLLPVIVTPKAGKVIVGDWQGPITIDFTGAPAATYTVSVERLEGCDWYPGTSICATESTVVVDENTTTETVDLDRRLARDGVYRISVSSLATETVTRDVQLVDTWNDVKGYVTVMTPPNGSTIWRDDGSDVPVILRYHRRPAEVPDYFEVTATGPDGEVYSETTSPNDYDNLGFKPTTYGTYRIDVVAPQDGVLYASSRFEWVEPPVLDGAWPRNGRRFYPTVRDGYQDKKTIDVSLTEPARLTWSVSDETGRIVRAPQTTAVIEKSHASLVWNGLTSMGDKVPVGSYTVSITAANEAGRSSSDNVRLVVDSRMYTEYKRKRWSGTATSERNVYGRCDLRRHWKYGLVIRCRDDGTACLDYRLRLPKGAIPYAKTARLWHIEGDGWRNLSDNFYPLGNGVLGYTVCTWGDSWYSVEWIQRRYKLRYRI